MQWTFWGVYNSENIGGRLRVIWFTSSSCPLQSLLMEVKRCNIESDLDAQQSNVWLTQTWACCVDYMLSVKNKHHHQKDG